MGTPGGYMHSILMVALDSRECTVVEVEHGTLRAYIGGSGLATRLLFDELRADVAALDHGNTLAILTGPLTGTHMLCSDRFAVASRSPLGGWGEADAGGTWGGALKRCGFDGLLIKGQSDTPVYLELINGCARVCDARDLWGRDTYQTADVLTTRYRGRCEVLTIGPAGENLVKFAGVFANGKHARAAARCGLGAVMGAKRLKAVVVVRGDGFVPVFDRKGLLEQVRRIARGLRERMYHLTLYGTAGQVLGNEEIGDLPTMNWTRGMFTFEKARKISGHALTESVLSGRYHCGHCPIGCGRVIRVTSGRYGPVDGAGPEYEALAALGSLCLVDDLYAICAANELCNRYGMDVISVGGVVAFAMEAFERGILTASDNDGADLRFGDPDALIRLIHQIGRREGLGDLLAEGVRLAADRLGPEASQFALHVKGLEPAMHDPRALSSMGVAYATHPRGACHRGYSHLIECGSLPEVGLQQPIDRHSHEGKGKLVARLQDYAGLFNSLKLCQFILPHVQPSDIVRCLNLVTGWDMSFDELMTAGERATNLKRLFNLVCGIGPEEDRLPSRLADSPLSEGGAAGYVPPMSDMLSEYYSERGWSSDGIPLAATLERLGLASDMRKVEESSLGAQRVVRDT